jgi:CheY-like chemotaxis protein
MLPATEQPIDGAVPPDIEESGGNGELVLLVEDEGGIREVARRILERRGYRVLAAADGHEAIGLAREHDGAIDLLITDVIMPGMLGKEVAEQILALRPDTQVLYMSGYAQPILGESDNLPKGMVLLEKPFTEHVLLSKAREALSASRSAA